MRSRFLDRFKQTRFARNAGSRGSSDGRRLECCAVWRQTPDAKPWKGLGPGVFEVVSDYKTDTFRAGYVVRFEHALYVLHCFQKKSPSGTRTAKTDVEMIERRLKAAQVDYEARYGQASQKRR